MIERLRNDAVSALRSLRSRPATAAGAILTLAIAAGLNLAMFGLIDRALVSPPARVEEPNRVFTLAFERSGPDGQPFRMTTASYVAFESIRSSVPEATVSASRRVSAGTIVDDRSLQVDATLVSGSYFGMLGAAPELGRTILQDDDRAPAGAPVAVLSHIFWASAFSGARDVIGRRIAIQGRVFVVVGVIPAGFSGHSSARTDVWVPLHAAMDPASNWDRNPYRNVVEIGLRLGAGQNVAAAETQASTASNVKVVLSPITGLRIAPAEHTIAYWLAAVSLLVLAIGLANTATLYLVRLARRQRELAIRVALGATRARLFSELVVEAAIVAAAATVAAVLLAAWVDEAVRRLLLPSLVERSAMTFRLAAAAAGAGLCALIVGSGAIALQLRALSSVARSAGSTRSSRRAAPPSMSSARSEGQPCDAGVFGRSRAEHSILIGDGSRSWFELHEQDVFHPHAEVLHPQCVETRQRPVHQLRRLLYPAAKSSASCATFASGRLSLPAARRA